MPHKPTLVPARDGDVRVDVGALAADCQLEAAKRIAETFVHVADWLEEEGRPLDPAQQMMLLESTLRHFDGFEITVAQKLKRELEQAGVPVWGLPSKIEKLLSG